VRTSGLQLDARQRRRCESTSTLRSRRVQREIPRHTALSCRTLHGRHPQLIERIAKLGAIPTPSRPMSTITGEDARIGAERLEWMFAVRSFWMRESG